MNGRTRVSISENMFQRAGYPRYEISEPEYLWRGLTPRQPTNPDLRGWRESSKLKIGVCRTPLRETDRFWGDPALVWDQSVPLRWELADPQ